MRRFSFLVTLILVASALQAGTWGSRGISRRFVVQGNLLYAADGRGVTVYDVSDVARMRAIDIELAEDETFDVAFAGGEALTATNGGVDRYSVASNGALTRAGRWEQKGGTERVAATSSSVVASRENTLFVLERHGGDLALRAQLPFTGRVLALQAVGRYVYAAVEREGIYVFDPPSVEPVFTLPRSAEALALSGSTLWTASRTGGLMAIDVRDPASPRVVSTTGLGTIEMDGVAAAGTRVYTFRAPDTVHTFDASDLAAPKLVATKREWVRVIGATASHLLLSGPRLDADKFPYETGTPVRAFDAATQALAGEVHDYAGPVSGVWTDGSLAYVVDPPFFRVLDVSKSDAPREITSIPLPYDAPQTRVRVKNGIALVYGRDYNHIIDVGDPIRPRLVATWFPRGHAPDDAAIMADGTFVELNDHSGIHVVDYKNSMPPVQIGGRISHFHAVAAGDDAIYALHEGWLLTMSVTNRAKAEDRSVVSMQGMQVETAPPNVDRAPLLVVTQGSGVRILDLTDRFVPKQVRFVATTPGQIATTAEHAIVDVDGVLHRLDLGTGELVATDMRVLSAMQISVAGDKVVVADRYGVRVFGPDTPPPPSLPRPRRRAVGR